MTAIQPVELPAELPLVAFPDAVVEAHAFGPDHPYIEAIILAVRQALAAHNEIRACRLPTTARRYHEQITRRPADVAVRCALGRLHVSPEAIAP